MASIKLTPDKPCYPGGTWHVEGTAHERIVATVIAYVDAENITASRLAFRTAVERRFIDERQDEGYVAEVFGLRAGKPMNQPAGALECAQGRVICFPNTMQHCVQPFALEDATRPGHRTIVAFFVVDPAHRVLSTRDVPPQQRAWWYEETRLLAQLQRMGVPAEVREMIDARIKFPIDAIDAGSFREVLMEERAEAKAVDEDDETYEMEYDFSLCEH